jgi:hypothetical protein
MIKLLSASNCGIIFFDYGIYYGKNSQLKIKFPGASA